MAKILLHLHCISSRYSVDNSHLAATLGSQKARAILVVQGHTHTTQSQRFSLAAMCRGESPWIFTACRSHLAARSISAMSTQPENAAQCRQMFSSFRDKIESTVKMVSGSEHNAGARQRQLLYLSTARYSWHKLHWRRDLQFTKQTKKFLSKLQHFFKKLFLIFKVIYYRVGKTVQQLRSLASFGEAET